MVSSHGQVSGLGTGHPGDKVRKHRSPETAVTGSRLWERVLRQRGGTGDSWGTLPACREPAPLAAGAPRWQRGPERDSSAWLASLSPSKANVLCSPCHSAPRLKAKWSLHSGSLVPVQDKDASREERGEPTGLTQPGGPGRQASTWPVGHGPLLPPPAPSALCPLTPPPRR